MSRARRTRSGGPRPGHSSQGGFVAFDLETTGLNAIMSEITEIGAVKFDSGGRVLDRFSELANPGMPVPENITKMTGISDEMVQDARPSFEVAADFVDWLDDCQILFAHSASFDSSFIATTLAKAGINPPQLPVFDTVSWACNIGLPTPNFKLETLLNHIDYEPSDFHRALPDAESLKVLTWYLMEESEYPVTEEDLAEFSDCYELCSYAGIIESLPAKYRKLQRAIETRNQCSILYATQNRTSGFARDIWPHHTFYTKKCEYLSAHCCKAGITKLFRLDKILRVL